MDALLEAFGIDWRLLIINMVNFGLLLAALWYFLYGPLMRMLDERRDKIAKGVQDAQEAQRQLAEITQSRSDALAAAGKEADAVISQARGAATAKEREILARGEQAAAAALKDAEAQAREMKARAIDESKQEVAKLVVLGIERAVAGK